MNKLTSPVNIEFGQTENGFTDKIQLYSLLYNEYYNVCVTLDDNSTINILKNLGKREQCRVLRNCRSKR